MRLLCRTALLICTAALASCTPRYVERRSADSYLLKLTGPDFVNCGGYVPGAAGWEELQEKVLNCAMQAVAEDKPFQFRESGLVTDSVYVKGLLRTLDGRLLQYNYDSAPCGNPSCRERFMTQSCEQPRLFREGRWLRFACDVVHNNLDDPGTRWQTLIHTNYVGELYEHAQTT